jgi:hypothetical protein
MSDTCPVPPQPAVAAADPVVSRVQKHVDLLRAKHDKLAAENARLKAALAEAKTSGSRIRRIPKKPAAPTTPTA